jgi:hypothetical protein
MVIPISSSPRAGTGASSHLWLLCSYSQGEREGDRRAGREAGTYQASLGWPSRCPLPQPLLNQNATTMHMGSKQVRKMLTLQGLPCLAGQELDQTLFLFHQLQGVSGKTRSLSRDGGAQAHPDPPISSPTRKAQEGVSRKQRRLGAPLT